MRSRILLVDDNEEFLDSTKDVIEDEGYEVLTATSGEEAVRRVVSEPFDLVIMDIKMPRMNGVDAFVEMKKVRPNIKVIMCTAYIVEATIRMALREGARAVLNKPFEMESLLSAIESAVKDRVQCSVLIADRSESVCSKLQDVVSAQGYLVATACFGPEAVTKATEQDFDVVVLDQGLPLLDGVEVYRRIAESRSMAPATIITGSRDELDCGRVQALKTGSRVTELTRPLDPQLLLAALENVCPGGKPGAPEEPETEQT